MEYTEKRIREIADSIANEAKVAIVYVQSLEQQLSIAANENRKHLQKIARLERQLSGKTRELQPLPRAKKHWTRFNTEDLGRVTGQDVTQRRAGE